MTMSLQRVLAITTLSRCSGGYTGIGAYSTTGGAFAVYQCKVAGDAEVSREAGAAAGPTMRCSMEGYIAHHKQSASPATQAAGPRQSREQLLDRYHSHTKNCKACSGALRNTRRGIAVVGFIGMAAALASAVAAAAALSGGAAAAQVGTGLLLHFRITHRAASTVCL